MSEHLLENLCEKVKTNVNIEPLACLTNHAS